MRRSPNPLISPLFLILWAERSGRSKRSRSPNDKSLISRVSSRSFCESCSLAASSQRSSQRSLSPRIGALQLHGKEFATALREVSRAAAIRLINLDEEVLKGRGHSTPSEEGWDRVELRCGRSHPKVLSEISTEKKKLL